MKNLGLITLIALLIFAACKTSKKTTSEGPVNKQLTCPDKALTFTNDIKPIFEKNCTRCHNTNERAGFNFHKFEFVKKAAQSGKLLGVIKHLEGYPPMPRHVPGMKFAAKLSQKNIDKIECWIKGEMKE